MQTAYSSSKFGINGLTKSCAKELGQYNIRVNAVAPGVVLTDMVAHSVNDQMMEGMRRITPLGRAAEPNELAGASMYILPLMIRHLQPELSYMLTEDWLCNLVFAVWIINYILLLLRHFS